MKIDKKYYPMIAVTGGVLLLLVIIVVVFMMVKSGNKSYVFIENKMVNAAQAYYKENAAELPKELGEQVEIDISRLIAASYMQEISEYRKDETCSGRVVVTKVEKGNDYTPDLNCGSNYKTVFLVDKLLGKVVTEGDGLYAFQDAMTASKRPDLLLDPDGYDLASNPLLGEYVYRGIDVNNYINIDGLTFRIVKIDKNNDMVLLFVSGGLKYYSFDKRYNSDFNERCGYNNFNQSSIKRTLVNDIYKNYEKNGVLASKTVPKNICIGGRTETERGSDGKAECSQVLKNQYIAFLPVFDVMNASLSPLCTKTTDLECSNLNYIVEDVTSFTITPNVYESSSLYIYSDYDAIESLKANTSLSPAYTIFLSNRVLYASGDGSEAKPYKVK